MRITPKAAQLLGMFLADPAAPRYGGDLTAATGMPPGTIYPLLRRMEAAGLLTSTMEEINQSVEQRPARVMYTLTDPAAARGQLEEFTARYQMAPRLPAALETRLEADARAGVAYSKARGAGVTAIHWKPGDPNPLAAAIIEHVHGPVTLILEGRTYQVTPA